MVRAKDLIEEMTKKLINLMIIFTSNILMTPDAKNSPILHLFFKGIYFFTFKIYNF